MLTIKQVKKSQVGLRYTKLALLQWRVNLTRAPQQLHMCTYAAISSSPYIDKELMLNSYAASSQEQHSDSQVLQQDLWTAHRDLKHRTKQLHECQKALEHEKAAKIQVAQNVVVPSRLQSVIFTQAQ